MKNAAAMRIQELAKDQSSVPRLAPGTLQKYFSVVRSFLSWCEDEGYLENSSAKKIKTASATNQSNARDPFSADQLEKLFISPLYSGCKSASRRSTHGDLVLRDAKYWIPLVGLFSGMRLGEIVLLETSDIRTEGEVSHFDVSKEESEKSLKTKSSRRKIPVHSELASQGFLDFVEQRRTEVGSAMLFEVTLDSTGNQPSKWFGRYLNQIAIKTPRTTFHSFRHSFTQVLRIGPSGRRPAASIRRSVSCRLGAVASKAVALNSHEPQVMLLCSALYPGVKADMALVRAQRSRTVQTLLDDHH